MHLNHHEHIFYLLNNFDHILRTQACSSPLSNLNISGLAVNLQYEYFKDDVTDIISKSSQIITERNIQPAGLKY